MRMFEIPIGACSLWFEPLAEVTCPRQSPFTVPSPWLRPKATCHSPSFPTMMVSTPSTSGVLYNSVTTFTTFPFSLVACPSFFFLSWLVLILTSKSISIFLPWCAWHSVWHSPLPITGTLCISISLCLIILHFFFATSHWGYHVLDLQSQHI